MANPFFRFPQDQAKTGTQPGLRITNVHFFGRFCTQYTSTSRTLQGEANGLDSWFLVLGSWFLVLGSWFLVLGSWFLVLGSWFLVLGSWGVGRGA